MSRDFPLYYPVRLRQYNLILPAALVEPPGRVYGDRPAPEEFLGVMKFVADAMLGKLAKWLRAMGYDTCYRSRYGPGQLRSLAGSDRVLLSRDLKTVSTVKRARWIRDDRVGKQLMQLTKAGLVVPDPARFFTRCLLCNEPLEAADPEEAEDLVPEYVLNQGFARIRRCPGCGRHYWPGTHRERMLAQLRAWEVIGPRFFCDLT
ncbi:MAG: hypothetical protein JRF59_00840 [Deltaproteobacteria bacterium]|nr:hypothetical protein [Deltaproteobacteria bacterium]MBW1922821.1 hypothetical protein [Deltaproteobacteria bacterium]MBW1948212.1 hypothetical protein [Deltaproteobacteria bacterium]MBW2006558.1 hypothetical protein [Deltaproteobacteria bacterium]MBW2346373.1 hypothetical protein [Deltaproteobacteria bacterium]